MAKWVKCTDHKQKTLWVNLDNVTNMMPGDAREPGTEIVFVGGGQVIVRERPEDLIKQP
jgi:hypothetical protein